MSSHTLARALAPAFALILSLLPAAAQAAGALLLWPIHQVIESDQKGSALWLENRGRQPISLQVRIFDWSQQDYQDLYTEQQQVLASPPFVTIAPGQRQLVRLMRPGSVPAGSEQSLRVIVDEIPNQAPPSNSVGLKFQMRYSIPLFLQGDGIWTKPRANRPRPPASASHPELRWRLVNEQDGRFLEVRNSGKVHARLSNVAWHDADGRRLPMNEGLLGYVLPGSTMRWPLKPGLQPNDGMQLKLQVADNQAAIHVAHQ
ncbi:molecular chaperone [Stenotrophomonas sp. MMGLT7]|uniref:fimbrial biogenesis chaperone n=1 Tax=Stenotrophomonas sp. MMGLT7 TaxID=2901227 RepID=UPI001E495EE1|nr:molecular chaperone [Stenotrophomonas sp. MMGLT7]MCD7098973.1 molecular chaperone [Stenotrophomonas sp. MMGLT7]